MPNHVPTQSLTAEQSYGTRATLGPISPNFRWMSQGVPGFLGMSNYKSYHGQQR